jgi:protein-tyrosine-phosphatase
MPSFKIDPQAVKVMKEVGVSLTSYVPRIVNQRSIAEADVVILMGKEVSPRAFAPKAVWNFQDPTGQSIAFYRQLRDAIRLNVVKLIVEMHRSAAEPAAAEHTSATLL